MTSRIRSRLAALGFLRLGLLGLAIVNVVVAAFYRLLSISMDTTGEESAWITIPMLVAPVMAPILIVVILFDYIMSRVRAADEDGEGRAHHVFIYRIDLFFIGFMLLYWVPFFITL